MITNIVDRRMHRYKFKKINAIVEAAWHDNSVKGADQVAVDTGPSYAERNHISVEEAIKWANGYETQVTLFLYGPDDGTTIHREHRE